jgi:hypothetical protein
MQDLEVTVLIEFEQISEIHAGKMIGGFSKSFSIPAVSTDYVVNNNYNCNTGNCTEGCGDPKQNNVCRNPN